GKDRETLAMMRQMNRGSLQDVLYQVAERGFVLDHDVPFDVSLRPAGKREDLFSGWNQPFDGDSEVTNMASEVSTFGLLPQRSFHWDGCDPPCPRVAVGAHYGRPGNHGVKCRDG